MAGIVDESCRTITYDGKNASIRTTIGFTAGTHCWTLRVHSSGSGCEEHVRVGIVSSEFGNWDCEYDPIGNAAHGYGFYSSNSLVESWQQGEKPPAFTKGDLLHFTLDLSARTLAVRNGSGAEVVVCKGLTDGLTYYPAATVYGKGHGVEILPS
jgi:hypothetical protein